MYLQKSCDALFLKTMEVLDERGLTFKTQPFKFRFLPGPDLSAGELEAMADMMEAGVKQL